MILFVIGCTIAVAALIQASISQGLPLEQLGMITPMLALFSLRTIRNAHVSYVQVFEAEDADFCPGFIITVLTASELPATILSWALSLLLYESFFTFRLF